MRYIYKVTFTFIKMSSKPEKTRLFTRSLRKYNYMYCLFGCLYVQFANPVLEVTLDLLDSFEMGDGTMTSAVSIIRRLSALVRFFTELYFIGNP